MSYMIYIDGYAAWSATSLAGAQDLARGYIASGHALKIVGSEAARHRVWIYDYASAMWLEASGDGSG